MAVEVKIVQFDIFNKGERMDAESELTGLLNEGWVIVAAGGGGGGEYAYGFVVLQRKR